MTTPSHIEMMKKSIAIITDKGGILSHAAIIARELGKICLVGTGNTTTVLKTGDLVKIDADSGIVNILKKK